MRTDQGVIAPRLHGRGERHDDSERHVVRVRSEPAAAGVDVNRRLALRPLEFSWCNCVRDAVLMKSLGPTAAIYAAQMSSTSVGSSK